MRRILFLVTLALISCNHQKINIKKEFIKQLSTYPTRVASPDIALSLFVKCSNDSLCAININELLNIYHKFYSKSNVGIERFVGDALNQKISFQSQVFAKSFATFLSLDKEIEKEYHTLSFSDFKTKYTSPHHPNVFLVENRGLSEMQLYSVLYYFFINNYKVYSDDYAGYFYVNNA